MDRVQKFSVGTYIPWLSDHCIIETTLSLKSSLAYENIPDDKSHKIHPGFLWNDLSLEKLENELKSDEGKQKITYIINGNLEPQNMFCKIKSALNDYQKL